MGKNSKSLIAQQLQQGELQLQQLQQQLQKGELQQQQLQQQLLQGENNNQPNTSTKGTFPTWYYAAGAAVFIVIALLVYFFVFRKSSSTTTSSSSSPAAVATKTDTKSPAAKTDTKSPDAKTDTKSPDAKTDTPVEEQADSGMFPETAASSSLPQDYQIFKSVADTKKALGLNDKKDKVTSKDYKNTKYLDAIGIIDGKLRINDMCIKKDKDNDFTLVKCTDVLGDNATYDETTKILKNGTRCLRYDDNDGLKMDTKCKASDKKYQWTKALLPPTS